MNINHSDALVIAGKTYRSRLLTGTGKFKDLEETRVATEAAGAEIVTLAIRRVNIGQIAGEPNLLDALPKGRYTLLPNTAGCYTADDAVRTLRLARELLRLREEHGNSAQRLADRIAGVFVPAVFVIAALTALIRGPHGAGTGDAPTC